MTGNALFDTLLNVGALSGACALLSVIVVLRRWAFIGEGIAHSGFGGAGTAWLLSLALPAMDQPWTPYMAVVIFCIGTSLAIGALSRSRGINADAAIGIFMVASLAWGFLAMGIYQQSRGRLPVMYDNLLFGQLVDFEPGFNRLGIAVCLAVIGVIVALWKEIISYSFDPLLAATSGVRTGFIHYLLMVLLGVVIVIGIRIAGSVLVTALLVLPGAAALQLSRRLGPVLRWALVLGIGGTMAGVMVNLVWRPLPRGPAIVLILFVEFLAAFIVGRLIQQQRWIEGA